MICLAKYAKTIRPIYPSLNRRTIAPAEQRRVLLFRTAHWHASKTASPAGDNGDVVNTPKTAGLQSVKTQKKAIRQARRAKERAEARIPGTEAFLKAKLKAEKHAKKEARKARIAAGEPLTDELDIKAEEQAKRDREQAAKKKAEPVRRQARRDLKQDRRKAFGKAPEHLHEDLGGRFKIRRTQPDWSRKISKLTQNASKMSRLRSPDYKPRVYKTKEEYELERSKGRRDESGETVGLSNSRILKYKSRDDKSWNSTEPAPWNFVNNLFDGKGSSTTPAEASFSRFRGTKETSNTRAWDNNDDDEDLSSKSNHRQSLQERSKRSARDSNGTARSRRSDDRRDRTGTASSSRSRSDGRYAEREPWMIQKEAVKRKIGGGPWAPPQRLSPDTLEAIRTMHKSDPDRFSTPILAQQFEQSPEVIRRILRTKWQPNEEEVLDRQKRWERRGEKIWTKQAELGVRPPKKWREMGVANTGEAGVAPKYKRNAYASDRYGERPKFSGNQGRGAPGEYGEAGFRKPFSDRIL
ncbi:hypothetical protein FKW77_009099 [Venturia effusa]|uniref:Required for respiratory growth protein 9, mitochondrial n=1 Tax=Venturia effusa TaxID=50376 RepID=A0A517LEH0_9PEZI|nr:hypothetical protein FKW77_009099 [Venturia effusa]